MVTGVIYIYSPTAVPRSKSQKYSKPSHPVLECDYLFADVCVSQDGAQHEILIPKHSSPVDSRLAQMTSPFVQFNNINLTAPVNLRSETCPSAYSHL